MTSRSLCIGITIGLSASDESLWVNGIKQNALNLALLLQASPLKHRVYVVNTTTVELTDALPWDRNQIPTVALSEVKDELDVLIELGGAVDDETSRQLKARGGKLVSYCCGSEYTVILESILFGRSLWPHGFYINRHYDQMWVIPQVANSSLHFLKTFKRCSIAKVVPFVWNPQWLTTYTATLPHHAQYQARHVPKRIAVMEPNHNVLKACIYPIWIAEATYRQRPNDIECLYVTNAKHLADSSKEFQTLMFALDIVQNHKAIFLDHYQTADFLSQYADIVISHQWDNPLNYFYFDVCWLGYPLVHNAHLCQELGYYYPNNDVDQGAARVLKIMDHHDGEAESYLSKQRQLLTAYTPQNPELVAQYDELLAQLFH